MRTITLITIGKLKDRFYRDAASEYEKRLLPYLKWNAIEIKPSYLPENPSEADIEAALSKEAREILSKLPKQAVAIALCVEGKQISSEDFAGLLFDDNEANEAVFIIGGSHGLHESVKAAADFKLSLSKMTFPHRLSRVMLTEQVYRAVAINAGKIYHK
ncbi:MAG: 23S rRNA (pseudouridine(1915)-N(3))-methyltransferase RlmH [Oscillospiraceae bacterium]|nr:23S rRNA (pseudouridine(1915)-N(3))-methyltransferase RlmH [Oscillospiraceae bacterium]